MPAASCSSRAADFRASTTLPDRAAPSARAKATWAAPNEYLPMDGSGGSVSAAASDQRRRSST